jgi:hypothetical protein
VDEAEPNPLTHREFHLVVLGVIELLVLLLCLLQSFLDFNQEFVLGCHLSLHRRQHRFTWNKLAQRRRVPAIDNPERQRAQGGLKRGIVAVLCPW